MTDCMDCGATDSIATETTDSANYTKPRAVHYCMECGEVQAVSV